MLKLFTEMSQIRKNIILTGVISFLAFMISYSYIAEATFTFYFDKILGAFWLTSGITTIYCIIQFIIIGKNEI